MFVLPKKAQGLVKLQGGLQTNDLIQASHVLLSTPTPRKSDGVMMSARSDWRGHCCLCWIRLIYDLGGDFWTFSCFINARAIAAAAGNGGGGVCVCVGGWLCIITMKT